MKMARTILLSIILVSCCCQLNEGLRILVLSPFNSRSHDAMSDRLAKALAARGHHIDAYTHHPPKKSIANYNHHSLDGVLPAFTNNMNFNDSQQFRGDNARVLFKKIAEPVCELMGLPVFEKLLKDPPTYDLVILQMFVTECYTAWAHHLNAPFIGISAISATDWYNAAVGNPMNTAVTPTFGTDLYPPLNFWQRVYNTVWYSFGQFTFGQIFEDQKVFVERYFGSGYPSMAELRRNLDLLITNTHHSLDGVKAHTPAVMPAAGIHIVEEDDTKLPEEVQRWLDDSNHGCVYFTFGSMVRIETLPKEAIDAFYAAFQNIAPVRVLMKIAKPEALPPGLPSNVMTQSWFPQVQVFKHKNVKAFITHGGLLSAIEAIHGRVPMIGIPLFGDQPHNVQMNVHRGIATAVDIHTITADKLTEAIKDVLNKPSYKENMDKLSRKFNDRPMKPLDEAIYWVEYVARHGKRCLRSPLVDMPWWQTQLIDVYGFILSVVLVIYCVLKFLIKKMLRMCCGSRKKIPSDKQDSKKKQ